jgi:hypothetical protein
MIDEIIAALTASNKRMRTLLDSNRHITYQQLKATDDRILKNKELITSLKKIQEQK